MSCRPAGRPSIAIVRERWKEERKSGHDGWIAMHAANERGVLLLPLDVRGRQKALFLLHRDMEIKSSFKEGLNKFRNAFLRLRSGVLYS